MSKDTIFNLNQTYNDLINNVISKKIYSCHLDKKTWHILKIDLSTLEYGQHSDKPYYGHKIECQAVELHKDGELFKDGFFELIVPNSFIKELIRMKIIELKIYKIKFKNISQRSYRIEQLENETEDMF